MFQSVTKKILSFALVCVGAVTLSACGADTNQAPAAGGSAPSASFTADVFWYTYADTFLASVRNSMIAQEADFPGLNVRHHDSMDNQATQTEQIQTAINQGTDLLVVNIVTTGAEDVAMNIGNLAQDAGIPVIFFNREVSDDVINAFANSVFVGTDADEAGVMQGQAIAEFLLEGDNLQRFDVNGDGLISYIMFRGEHGNAEAFGRTFWSVYTANQLLAPHNVRLVPSPANEVSTMYADDGISNYFLYGNWSAAIAGDLMRTALVAHSLTDGSIELIIANNDDQAIGAIEALSEAGFNTGNPADGFIPVFGVDATAVAMTNIADGRMTATILQDGVAMSRAVLELTQNVADGNDLLHDTARFNMDAGVAKIRIPHAIAN